MPEEPSFSRLVTQVLQAANHPLTLAEIRAQVELTRPVRTRNPDATVRGSINNNPLAISLGGRPVRYTWWPHHLANNAFRQPLTRTDIEDGGLVLRQASWLALWPDFFAGNSRSKGNVTLDLAGGPSLQTCVQHLVPGQAVWGFSPLPALADWYAQQKAAPDDDVIVRVLDVDTQHYAMSLVHRDDRDNAAIAARNRALTDAAEKAIRASTRNPPHFHLIPRLIAQDVYCHPLPPDPWDDVLRADLRFVIGDFGVAMVEKTVNELEEEFSGPFDPYDTPRPHLDRHKIQSEEEHQAWGTYLYEKGMVYLWNGQDFNAEAYFREALQMDPGHADAWVHLGNLRFRENRVTEALENYLRGQAAAEARTIGDPAQYPGPFWGDLDSRPFLRALHGRGLCLWRLERASEAREIFTRMLALNPNDNQGVRFLVPDLDAGLSWEESLAKDDEYQR